MAKLLRDIAEGSVVHILEDGVYVPFYVAKHDYESGLNGKGKTALLRKYVLGETLAWSTTAVTDYSSSTINTYLNGTYLSKFSASLRELIGTTRVRRLSATGSSVAESKVTPFSTSVFLASMAELGYGFITGSVPEGSELPNAESFAVGRTEDGTAAAWWTRTIKYSDTSYAFVISEDGGFSGYTKQTASKYVRPLFTLPEDKVYVTELGRVYLEGETVFTAGDCDLGIQTRDFDIPYEYINSEGGPCSFQEMLDGKFVRTLESEANVEQKMHIDVSVLTPGTHTVTLSYFSTFGAEQAEITFEIPSILIEYDEEGLDDVRRNAVFSYAVTENAGAEVTVTEVMDGTELRSLAVESGSVLSVSIEPRPLAEGKHELSITAVCGEESTAVQIPFEVSCMTASPGGSVQEFQDEKGEPVFPLTLAKAVIDANGESVETILQRMTGKRVTGTYTGTGVPIVTGSTVYHNTLPVQTDINPKYLLIACKTKGIFLFADLEFMTFVTFGNAGVGVTLGYGTIKKVWQSYCFTPSGVFVSGTTVTAASATALLDIAMNRASTEYEYAFWEV